jgi:DNA-binding transcriptional regulator YdaS (Cro superfamily)
MADRRKVLTNAVIRAARALAINQSKVAATLGVSDPTVSRMFLPRAEGLIRVLLYLDAARGRI